MSGHFGASGSVRRSPRKAGPDAWEVAIRPPHGRQFTKVIGRVWAKHTRPPEGYLTRADATGILRGMLVEADHGRLARQQAVGITFGAACDEWLDYIEHDRKRSPTTVRDYRSSVTAILVPFFGTTTALNAITAQHVDAFRLARAESGSSAATVNKHMRLLHGIFKRGTKLYGLTVNPAAGVERQPHEDSGDFDHLLPTEVVALAGAVVVEQDAALYVTAAFSGLRFGELRALTWADVDFTAALIHVRWNHPMTARGRKRPKGRKVRSVPLLPEVAQVLDGLTRRAHWTDAADLVFVNVVGNAIDASNTTKAYKRALSEAGLRAIRFHDLRHTFGTLGAQVWELPRLQAYMGHTSVTTTMRYVHHVPRHDDAHKLSALIQSNLDPAYSLRAGSFDPLR